MIRSARRRFATKSVGLTEEFWEPDLVTTFSGTGNTLHELGMIETAGGKARYARNGLLQLPVETRRYNGQACVAPSVSLGKTMV